MDYQERQILEEIERRHDELLKVQGRQAEIIREQVRMAEREQREKRDAERREREKRNKMRMEEGITSISKALALQPGLIVNLSQILLPDVVSSIDSIMGQEYRSKGESTIDEKILPIINVLPEQEREKLITQLKSQKEIALQSYQRWKKEQADQQAIGKKKREEKEKFEVERKKIDKKMNLLVIIRRVCYAIIPLGYLGDAFYYYLFSGLAVILALLTAAINKWWYWPKHYKLWEKYEGNI